ncbi:hypothetical protein [Polyangium spumosum]|uniref:Uncharacterized protein n=1 Tax=Polyangium spumosum TaxID=889282 RepID=A0A6N7PQ48_9BACT|nr:hypothetical protein [Polyangium spumosum]MRG93747.1 hypothetical protein [Polyangium spumosum]
MSDVKLELVELNQEFAAAVRERETTIFEAAQEALGEASGIDHEATINTRYGTQIGQTVKSFRYHLGEAMLSIKFRTYREVSSPVAVTPVWTTHHVYVIEDPYNSKLYVVTQWSRDLTTASPVALRDTYDASSIASDSFRGAIKASIAAAIEYGRSLRT